MAWLPVLILAVSALPARGALQLSTALGDSMVLQRAPQRAVLWGTASEQVTVTLAAKKYTALPDSTGSWRVQLDPMPAGPHGNITITSGGDTVLLTDVVFGDVFLCSGQSNMQFSLSQVYDNETYINEANNPRYRDIRLFTVRLSSASAPRQNVGVLQKWARANSTEVGDPTPFSYFSAVCWFAGKDIFDRLGGSVPVGLVASSYGGTPVEFWVSQNAAEKCPVSGKAVAGGGWNAMVVPLLPMRLSGVFWLQGESNVGHADHAPEPGMGGQYYSCAFPAMISDWRAKFGYPLLPFIFVQLGPYETRGAYFQLPALREAQMKALSLPTTGYATAVDLGDTVPSDNPWGCIHFRNKAPLGPRLGAVAADLVYQQNTSWRSPEVDEVVDLRNGSYAVSFAHVAAGLVLQHNRCPFDPPSPCAWWTVADAKGMMHNVTEVTVLSPNRVLVTSPVPNPTELSYLYGDWPVATIFASSGLPALPFNVTLT